MKNKLIVIGICIICLFTFPLQAKGNPIISGRIVDIDSTVHVRVSFRDYHGEINIPLSDFQYIKERNTYYYPSGNFTIFAKESSMPIPIAELTLTNILFNLSSPTCTIRYNYNIILAELPGVKYYKSTYDFANVVITVSPVSVPEGIYGGQQFVSEGLAELGYPDKDNYTMKTTKLYLETGSGDPTAAMTVCKVSTGDTFGSGYVRIIIVGEGGSASAYLQYPVPPWFFLIEKPINKFSMYSNFLLTPGDQATGSAQFSITSNDEFIWPLRFSCPQNTGIVSNCGANVIVE